MSANQLTSANIPNGKKFTLDIPLDVPPALEKIQTFTQYDAGHRRDEISPFKATLHTTYSSTQQVQKQRQLNWGDYVRISHILLKDKKSGVLFSEMNVSGTSQDVLLETHSTDILHSPENYSSIFQIIPPTSDLLGKALSLEVTCGKKYQKIRLRHLISGRYITFDDDDQLKTDENYDEFFEKKAKQFHAKKQFNQNSNLAKLKNTGSSSQIIETLHHESKKDISVQAQPEKKSVFNSISNIFTLNKNKQQSSDTQLTSTQAPNLKQSLPNIKEKQAQENLNTLSDSIMSPNQPNYIVTLANEGVLDTVEDEKLLQKPATGQDNPSVNKILNNEFIDTHSLIISSSSSEEQILTTTCVFQISNLANHKKLILDYNDDPLLLINPELVTRDGNYFITNDVFYGVFQPMNSLSRHVYKVKCETTKKPDYFFFQKVGQQEIRDIMSVHSKISSILLISDDSYLTMEHPSLFQKAEDDLFGLAQWMCNNPAYIEQSKAQAQQLTKQPIKCRQNLIRELGIIDLIIKIICNIYNQQWMESDLMKKNYYMRTFISSTIKILELTCLDNYPNSVYTYQWYYLFKSIILDVNVYEDFRFDILINQLFQTTLLNVGLKADLNQIIESVNFEDYNLKALNLMTAFCQYNSYREKQEQEQIIETLFENQENREKIFKKLVESDRGEVCLEIQQDEQYLELKQKNFDNNANIIQLHYVVGIIQLIIELCRGGVWLVEEYIKELFPQNYMIYLFESTQVNTRFRSAFLDLFRESYIMKDFQNIQESKIPLLVHVKSDTRVVSKSLEKLRDLKFSLMMKYLYENETGEDCSPVRRGQGINLKSIILNSLKEFLNKITTEYKYCESGLDHQKFLSSNVFTKKNHSSLLFLSVLKLAQFLIKRDFYVDNELDQFHDSIEKILKKSLELVQLIKKQEKKFTSSNNINEELNFSIENFEWIDFSITLLKDICLYKQNQFLIKFYDTKPDEEYQNVRRNEIKEELELKSAEKRNPRKKSTIQMKYFKRMQQLMIDKILLKEHASKYLTNQAPPLNEKFINLLHCWLNLGLSQLNTNIMNLILSYTSANKGFLESVNESLTINSQNYNKYEMFLDIYYELHFDITDYLRVKSNETDQEEIQIKKMSIRIQEIIKEVFINNITYDEVLAIETTEKKDQEIEGRYSLPKNGSSIPQNRAFGSVKDGQNKMLHDVIESYKENEKDSVYSNDQVVDRHRISSAQSRFQELALNNQASKQGTTIEKEIHGLLIEDINDTSSAHNNDTKIVHCISPRDINNYFSSPELQDELKNLTIFSYSNSGRPNTDLTNQYPLNFSSRNNFNGIDKYRIYSGDISAQNGIQFLSDQNGGFSEQIPINSNQIVSNLINSNQIIRSAQKLDQESSHFDSPTKESKPVYYQLYLGYIVDINYLISCQKMMNCISIQDELIEILIQVSQATTLAKKENKNQLIYDCLALLNYFILKNSQNQTYLLQHAQFLEEHNGLLKKLIQHTDIQIIELTFLLLKNVYCDNYKILLEIDQKVQHDLFQRLTKKFQESFKRKSNIFCILFIQFLPYLFQLQGKTLIQNQSFVIKQLILHQVDLNQYIYHFANKALESKIPKNDWMIDGGFNIYNSPVIIRPLNPIQNLISQNGVNQTQSEVDSPNHAALQPNKQMSIKNIQLTEDIIILISFLRTFRQIAKNSSSYVNNYIRSLFTIKQISDLIQELDNWWPLKLELLLYLTEAYLNQNRIEETETIELIHLFSVVLAEEMYKYEHHLSRKKSYVFNLQFTTDIPNVFNETHVGTFPNQPYVQVSYEESYDQFIVLGIMRSLRYFINKQPENPDDMFLGILSQYQECIDEVKDFMDGPFTEKLFTIKKRRSDRKKTHRRSSQFFSLEISPAKNSISQSLNDEKIPNQTGQQQILIRDVTNLLDSIIKKEYIQTPLQKEQRNAFIRQQQLLHAKIVSELEVQVHHIIEINKLTELIIDVKTKDDNQFLRSLRQYLNVVSNVKEVSSQTRTHALKILRNISNFKKIPQLYELIQIDLCQIGFMSFLCDAVVSEANPSIKSLYIDGLVDFLDESNILISDSYYEYMQNDESNSFIVTLKDFLLDNFKQYREYQKAQFDQKDGNMIIMEDWDAFLAVHQSSIQSQIQQEEYQNAIKAKLEKCISIMQLMKLCCENHCLKFQNFFRIQVNKNQKEKKNSINMITLITDIFAKFVKRIDKSNLSFGISILETLISLVEGPCIENQRELVSSKILENIEDLMLEIFDKETDSDYPKDVLMNFKNKIIRISISLFEGCGDQYIINKVGQFINPIILYAQIFESYEDYFNSIQLIRNKHKGVYLDFTGVQIPSVIQQQIKTIDDSQTLRRFVFDKYGNTPLAQKNDEMILVVYKKANQFLEFAQDCLALIKNLKFQNMKFKQKCIDEKKKLSLNAKKAYLSLKQTYKSIEIVNQFGRLQKVFYPRHTIIDYLSSTKQQRFLIDVNRDSANEKIQGLLSMENQFMDEMKHFLYLNAKGLYFKLNVLQNFKTTHLIIIIITNFFVLTGFDNDNEFAAGFIGVIQLISSSCIMLLWVVMELPLDYILAIRGFEKGQLLYSQSQGKKRQSISKKFYIFKKLLKDSHMLYLSLNIIFSILGMQLSKIFYTFLLIDIIDKSPVLRNVINAVTKNSQQLMLTGILGCILLVFYSTMGYYSSLSETLIYKDDDSLEICHSPFDCFLFMAGQGLRQGGGVGDIIKMPNPYDYSHYFSRFFYDLTFYLLINVLWLNIIFGIIVDSFAELRDEKKEKDKDQENKCFICHMDREKFENEGLSFYKHRFKEHQLWNYMSYIIHLKLKDQNKYNGTESYVHNKLQNDDITWFPIGKSIKLLKIQGENQFSQEQKLQDSIDKLSEKLQFFEKQMLNNYKN